MHSILSRLRQTTDRIQKACILAGRDPAGVRLLLATKTVAARNIQIALSAGYKLVGENKVQEIKEKYAELLKFPHEQHFIGHLQSNKIKDILQYDVSCIHSIDCRVLAEKLEQRLAAANRTIDILIQVNTSGERSKFGTSPADALALAKHISSLPRIRVKGLMTIGIFSADHEKVRNCFRILRGVQQNIARADLPGVTMKELSMGMSQDLEVAIEEGATIVRVGTAVFGERPTPDSYYWNEHQT